MQLLLWLIALMAGCTDGAEAPCDPLAPIAAIADDKIFSALSGHIAAG